VVRNSKIAVKDLRGEVYLREVLLLQTVHNATRFASISVTLHRSLLLVILYTFEQNFDFRRFVWCAAIMRAVTRSC
jgi:hypothetical protein